MPTGMYKHSDEITPRYFQLLIDTEIVYLYLIVNQLKKKKINFKKSIFSIYI